MSGVTASSPEPRRIPTPSWLDLRLVLGVALVLASVLIGATVVSRASDTHASVTATRDLAAGTILRSEDIRVTQVQLPDDGAGVYLDDVDLAVGRSLDRAVAKGELVPAAAIEEVKARTRVTVPLASGAAPRLHDGERVELWVSTSTCASVVLLPDVTIQDVRTESDATFGDGSAGQEIVISVDPVLAGRVIGALGIDGGQIRAGVLVGGRQDVSSPAPSSPTPGASGASNGSSGELPEDLAACTSPSATR